MKKIAIAIAAVLLSGCGLPTTTVTAPAPPPSTVQVTTTAAPAPSVPVETPEAPSQSWDGQTTESEDDQVIAMVSQLFEENYGQPLPSDMRAATLEHAKNYCTLRGKGYSSDDIFAATAKVIEDSGLSASPKKILISLYGWSYGAGRLVYCPEFPKDF